MNSLFLVRVDRASLCERAKKKQKKKKQGPSKKTHTEVLHHAGTMARWGFFFSFFSFILGSKPIILHHSAYIL